MRKSFKNYIGRISFVSLLIVTIANAQMMQGPPEHKQFIGKPMVDFKMVDLNGKTYTNKSLKGKVVLLDFWATWCGPCVAASPYMQKLHDKYNSDGLVVIAATVKDVEAKVRKHQAEHKYGFITTLDNGPLLKDKMGISMVPTIFVIDKKGYVRYAKSSFAGEKSYKEIESLVKKLLADKK